MKILGGKRVIYCDLTFGINNERILDFVFENLTEIGFENWI